LAKSPGPQSVIVTGAASGIGKACTEHLLSKNHNVLAVDLGLTRLKAEFPKPGPSLDFCAADISETEQCKNIIGQAKSRFGKINALIHWEATYSTKTWDAITAEELDRVLRVNVTGTFLIAQAAAMAMKDTGGGSIVLTGSSSIMHGATGEITGTGGPAYVASKASIIGIVRSLVKALYQIRVNSVMPGPTITPMTKNNDEQTRKHLSAISPLGRIASPEDIAEAGCFLISPEARFVSGESLIVNGATMFG